MPRSNDSATTSTSSGSFSRFEYQVAGHDRLLQHPATDIIVVKPCNKIEQKFYEDSQQHPEFLQWIPECYGSLHIATENERQALTEAQAIEDGVISLSLNDSEHTFSSSDLDDILFVHTALLLYRFMIFLDNTAHHICLENLLYGFVKPCVMDLKLGTQLYGPDATPAKRAKMILKAQQTTSARMGMKISGLQMFDSATNQQMLHTKEYIKQITEANITESFLSFFFPSSCYAETLIAGRERVNPLQNGLPIPSAKIRWIIQSLIDDIEEILETVASMPDLRIYGASLLIIYEGDRSAAMEAWGKMLEEDRQQAQRNQRGHVDQEPTDDKSECEDEEAQSAKLYSIRMIDFAHSEWTSGQFSEQDEGILLGLKNAANMLRSLLVIQRQDNL